MKTIKVFITEDHNLVRDGLKKILSLEKDIRVVGEASSGEEALSFIRTCDEKNRPDIILMDIGLPDMSGIDAMSKIFSLSGTGCEPQHKVIILSMHDDEDHIMKAVKAGCSGYIVKSAPSENLIKAIRLVNAGETVIPRDLTSKLVQAVRKNQYSILSPKETEVLKLLARGLSNKAIARELSSSAGTVKNQVNSIFSKLKVNNRAAAVSEAVKRGIL